MAEELRAVLRMQDEATGTVQRVNREVERMTGTATRGATEMTTGFSRVSGQLSNMRGILGHLTAGYIFMRSIQAFKQMAMEAKDVADRVNAIGAEWHEMMSGVAQESARFWLPIIDTLSKALQVSFSAIRTTFITLWSGILTIMARGLQTLIDEMGPTLEKIPILGTGALNQLTSAQSALADEAARAGEQIKDEASATKDLFKELQKLLEGGGRESGVARMVGRGMRSAQTNIAQLLAELQRLAAAYVEAENKAAEYDTSLGQTADLSAAYARTMEGIESDAQKLWGHFSRLKIDGPKVWQQMLAAAQQYKTTGEDISAVEQQRAEWIEEQRKLSLQAAEDAAAALEQQRAFWQEIKGYATEIGNIFVSNIMSAIDEIGEKTFKWQQAMRQLLADLAKFIIQTALKKAMEVGIAAVFGAAKGGVFKTGGMPSVPFRAYAGGGISRGPEMVLRGEAGVPEAHVPMPSGNIPVKLEGGQQPINVTFNLGMVDAGSGKRFLASESETIVGLVRRAVRENSAAAGMARS